MRGRSWTRRAGTVLIVSLLIASLFAPIGAASNDVTFDGELVLEGDPAGDGTSFEYNLESSDVDDFEIGLEGIEKTHEPVSVSGSLDDSNGISQSIIGNMNPESASLSVEYTQEHSEWESFRIYNDGVEDTAYYYFDDVDGLLEEIEIFYDASWESGEYSDSSSYRPKLYMAEGDVGEDALSGDGERIEFDMSSGPHSGSLTHEVDQEFSDGVTIAIDPGRRGTGSTWMDVEGVEAESVPDESIEVATDEGSASVPNAGSGEIDLGYGDVDIQFDETLTGSYGLEYTPRTISDSIGIDINGETVGYDGVLESGETTTLEPDTGLIEAGENSVKVSTANLNGIHSDVGLTYSHSAASDQTVSYDGEAWSERYNVSRTWDDATDDASVTIPFASNRVAEIRDAEKRINDGDWRKLEIDEIDMDGTTLEVNLGDVNADDEISVRATGSKVDVSGGEIEVLEPTVEGDTLDTMVEIVDHSDEFAVDVSGTTEGNWLHHTINESWSASSTSSVFHATGEQEIRAPGASSGSTVRVQTLPLEVSPNAGDVAISSVNPSGDELRFDSEPDGATEVDYTWYETNSGERYVLYSDTHGVVRDSATASSPVTLTGSSYDETLQIMSPSDDSGGDEIGAGSGASSSGVSGAVSQATGVSSPIMLIVVGVGLIAGMAVLTSRTDVPTWIIGIGGPLIGLVSLEAISPGTISSGISSTIVMVGSAIGDVWSEVGAPVMLIAVMVGAWLVVRWWQTREERASEPDTAVNFTLRDD